jgi:DNA-binding GntR family transcriptional regulator
MNITSKDQSSTEAVSRFARIKHSSLRDQIVDAIQRAIIHGRLKPGEKIAENEIAAELGVSRTPTREAIRILEQQGLLETRSKVGTFVTSVDWEGARNGLLLRITLEELAIRQALQRMTASEWSDFCDRLQDILHRMEKALKRKEYGLANELDVEWHSQHIEAADNRYLSQAWRLVGLPFVIWSPGKELYPQPPDRWSVGFIQRHAKILSALRSRNPDSCARVLRENILFNLVGEERALAEKVVTGRGRAEQATKGKHT